MTTPIIDPSTLSEEQKETIRDIYNLHNSLTPSEIQNAYQIGILHTLEDIFGSEFLIRNENNYGNTIY